MVKAIEEGWVQQQIQDVAFERQQEIESGERIIVGVNEFEIEEKDDDVRLEEVSEEEERRQKEQLQEFKDERDSEAVEESLNTLEDGAKGDANLMPLIIDAVKAGATVGEISDTLRDVFGEYHGGGI